MVETELKTCFVIMPFSKSTEEHTEEYWNKHYKELLEPLIVSSGVFVAKRSEALHDDILRQIITDLLTAPLVVADLTDANPNVYWELGVRQSFKHHTITIAEHGTKLPFDLTTKGTLFYHNNYYKMEKFKKLFLKAIEDCHQNTDSHDSYVLKTITGRGTLYQVMMRDESLRRLDGLISEIKNNESRFSSIMTTCNENLKIRASKSTEGPSFSTAVLSLCCVELLIANRYINADDTFYTTAETYMACLISVNERLPHWPTREESIEKWLKKYSPEVTKSLTRLLTQVEAKRDSVDQIR